MKNKLVYRGIVFFTIVLFVGASVMPSMGNPIVVKHDLQENKTTFKGTRSGGYIQDLIDNASDGDTIYIPSGTYYENIIINKSISLVGEDKDTTIIDGSEMGDVVSIVVDWVNISGFTIQTSGELWENAGIRINSNYNTIIGNNISNNREGILLYSSSGNNITGNIILYTYYYGIHLSGYYGSSNNTITGNTISKNSIGIYLYFANDNNITGNNISNIQCGIRLYCSSSNTITGNNITNNRDDGIHLSEFSGNNDITSNNINSNDEFGVGLFHSCSNTITGNNITNNRDDGIFLSEFSGNNNIKGNTISKNRIGIFLYNSSNNTIQRNNFLYNLLNALFIYYISGKNEWQQNYWNRPRILPKLIFGKIEINSKKILWVNIDWHPAKEPYDITTTQGCDIE